MKLIMIRLIPATLILRLSMALILILLVGSQAVFADDEIRKLVIQVSTDDVRTQNIAMNNAVNLQQALGQDNIIIEIVAYGPGLSMLTPSSPVSKRVPNLAMQDVIFSACANTMEAIEKKSGKKVELVDGVEIVQAGVLRILELQEQGYAYIRP
jgi:intracellular sulfur oxidation DsrE/DsrF family protein